MFFFLCWHPVHLLHFIFFRFSRFTKVTGYPQIYLDSDNLKNLEELFDTVRSHTRNLVVLATPAVFQRPWCAGEITCAYSSRIPVFLVNFVNGGQEEEEANPSRLKVNDMCSCSYSVVAYSRLLQVAGSGLYNNSQRRLRDFRITWWSALSRFEEWARTRREDDTRRFGEPFAERSSARWFRVEKITDEVLDELGQTFGADVPVLSENGVKLSDVEMACAPAKCSEVLYVPHDSPDRSCGRVQGASGSSCFHEQCQAAKSVGSPRRAKKV